MEPQDDVTAYATLMGEHRLGSAGGKVICPNLSCQGDSFLFWMFRVESFVSKKQKLSEIIFCWDFKEIKF